jgi:hypothetical protein
VPSFRPAYVLDHAIRLAETLGCALLVLCSGEAWARSVVARAPGYERVIAIDVAGLHDLLPAFGTSRLTAGTVFHRPTDTSFKRNLGLLIARVAGWQRIVFLDDDIAVVRATDLAGAAGLVGRYDAVGLANVGFPDNSVVCHALRMTGGRQGAFVGGGALAVSPYRRFSFFPTIYNEDWFFLLNRSRIGLVSMYGTAVQKEFDPFESPERAATEEFGDCLAEGIYWLLDNGRRISDADLTHWRTFLDRRQRLIDSITMQVIRSAQATLPKAGMLASLAAARERRAHITPGLCADYLQAWQRDRRLWCTFVQQYPKGLPVDVALKEIGVPDDAVHTA